MLESWQTDIIPTTVPWNTTVPNYCALEQLVMEDQWVITDQWEDDPNAKHQDKIQVQSSK